MCTNNFPLMVFFSRLLFLLLSLTPSFMSVINKRISVDDVRESVFQQSYLLVSQYLSVKLIILVAHIIFDESRTWGKSCNYTSLSRSNSLSASHKNATDNSSIYYPSREEAEKLIIIK